MALRLWEKILDLFDLSGGDVQYREIQYARCDWRWGASTGDFYCAVCFVTKEDKPHDALCSMGHDWQIRPDHRFACIHCMVLQSEHTEGRICSVKRGFDEEVICA